MNDTGVEEEDGVADDVEEEDDAGAIALASAGARSSDSTCSARRGFLVGFVGSRSGLSTGDADADDKDGDDSGAGD